MPPPLTATDDAEDVLEALPALTGWVRGTLVGMALGVLAVFAVAFWLDPYQADGTPRQMATHRQMGLPPCTFYATTGLPCPSCGMTTSFALLVRGDVGNSLRANAVGTLLAVACLLFVPWSVASVARGRPLFLHSLERAFTLAILVLLGLMLARWFVVVGLAWWSGALPGG